MLGITISFSADHQEAISPRGGCRVIVQADPDFPFDFFVLHNDQDESLMHVHILEAAVGKSTPIAIPWVWDHHRGLKPPCSEYQMISIS
jgi:hypothetical protein